MHARRGPGRPHFYYKGQPNRDRDDGLHSAERRKNEGIVHILMKDLIREKKYLTVLVNGEQERITFSDVRVEHRVAAPEGMWRIDLQCDVAGPKHVKELFQGVVNIEIWCHHRLPSRKVAWLCEQPAATIELKVWHKALHRIEQEESDLFANGEVVSHRTIQQWKNFLATTLDRPFSPRILWIPNDDHWIGAEQFDDEIIEQPLAPPKPITPPSIVRENNFSPESLSLPPVERGRVEAEQVNQGRILPIPPAVEPQEQHGRSIARTLALWARRIINDIDRFLR